MSRLGDFLEAVYGRNERWTTVRATVRCWRDNLYATVAMDRFMAQRAAAMREKPPAPLNWAPTEGPRVVESEWQVWLAGTDRGREELRGAPPTPQAPVLTVVNGYRRWLRDSAGRVANRNAHGRVAGLSHAEWHFDRFELRRWQAGTDLEEFGSIECAGEKCIRVRGVSHPEWLQWSIWNPRCADEYELIVHPDRAAVLSIIARTGGVIFETNEVTEVVYDEPLDGALFEKPTGDAASA